MIISNVGGIPFAKKNIQKAAKTKKHCSFNICIPEIKRFLQDKNKFIYLGGTF